MTLLCLLLNGFWLGLKFWWFTDQELGWLDFIWDHIVATQTWTILHLVKGVILLPSTVIGVELLNPGGLVLMLLVFVGEQADCAKLRSNDEAVTILGKLPIKGIVHDIRVN